MFYGGSMDPFSDQFFGSDKFTRREAYLWLLIRAGHGGQILASIRSLGRAWGWSKSSVDRYLKELAQAGLIGTVNRDWKPGHPQSLAIQCSGPPPDILPGTLSGTGSWDAPPPGNPFRGVSPSVGEAGENQPTNPPTVGSLGLTIPPTEITFQGKHLTITRHRLQEIETNFPGIPHRAVIEKADRAYARRKNKASTPDEFLTNYLYYELKDLQGRQAHREEVQETATTGTPLARATGGRYSGDLPAVGREPGIGYWTDLRLWWGHYGRSYLERGEWHSAKWGPKPWESGCRCPSGVFSQDEIANLRRKFDASGGSPTGERHSRPFVPNRQSKNQMPQVLPPA